MRILGNPLDYPGLAAHKRAQQLLRLWRYPSFEPYQSWSIIEAGKNLFLRRISLDQNNSFNAPLTFGTEVTFERELYETLADKLQAIEIRPFRFSSVIGLDGTSSGIEIGNHWLLTNMSWWQDGPEDWQPLREWHAQAIDLFQACLPASSAEILRQG